MADKKVSELTAITNLSGDDLLLVVNDPSGTPASRKITVNNLFGNVVVSTTHKARTTFNANVIIATNSVAATANVAITGGLSVNSTAILPAVQDRMQVANTTSLVNDRMQVANTTLLVNDRMQVANANALLDNPTLIGTTATTDLSTNTIVVIANTGLRVSVSSAPSSNNPTTEGWTAGTVAFSNTYLYIAVDANTIKRVPLSVF